MTTLQQSKNFATLIVIALLFSSTDVYSQSYSTGPAGSHARIETSSFDTSGLKTRIWGVGFFAPLNNHLAFDYEQTLGNQISFSGEVGVIGIGVIPNDTKATGLYLKAGPKLYFSPDYMMDGMYRYNNMQGSYFKPKLILNYFTALDNAGDSDSRTGNMAVALMLTFGKQWVVGNLVSLEIHAGLGYGTGGSDTQNQFGHIGGTSEIPVTTNAGLIIGFLSR